MWYVKPISSPAEILPHVCQARENKCFGWIESQRDNVLYICPSQSQCFVDVQILPQGFLIVAHLDYKRNIKSLLQPSRKFSSEN